MKINELVIGDWINVLGTPKQIEGIRKFRNGDGIVYYDGDNENFIENVTPIPLTNDILEKTGFEKCNLNIDGIKYNCYKVKYNMYLIQDYDEDTAYTLGSLYHDSDYGNTLIGFAWINYVHKLQHLMNDGICDKKILYYENNIV